MAQELRDVEAIADVITVGPLALLTDMDGTLSPIVDRAEEAYVPERVKRALGALLDKGVRVVVITGRSLEAARRMVEAPGVEFAAGHGVDLWVDGRNERPPEVREWAARARRAIADLKPLEAQAGVWVEDKEFGLAIHYRKARDGEPARAAILDAVRASAAAGEFDVQEGRKIVELRPRLAIDKGTAAGVLIDRLGVTATVCLGDDVTDIDMFREVRRRREEGTLAAAVVAVRSEEASEEVMASADWWVDGVDGVGRLLEGVVRRL